MDTIDSILTGHRPNNTSERVPMLVRPEVRERLRNLLVYNDELRGVGYSSFVERACEVAETAIAQQRGLKTLHLRDSCPTCEDTPAGHRWLCPNRDNHDPL